MRSLPSACGVSGQLRHVSDECRRLHSGRQPKLHCHPQGFVSMQATKHDSTLWQPNMLQVAGWQMQV